MRILLIADPMIPVPPIHYGGIERIIDMLCRDYVRMGHQVQLIAHPDSKTAGEFVPLPGLAFASKIDQLRNAWTIVRSVQTFRPDVVHSFGRLVQLLPLLPLKLRKVMSYQREPSLAGIGRAARLARRNSLLFTGCSDYITKQIASVAQAKTVYNGVPLSKFEFSATVADDAPLVFLGRVERIKGVHNAIEIANINGRRLLIAGNIPQEPEHIAYFEAQVKPLLNERIRFIGPVNDEKKNRLLGEALAFIMAIEWNEPFGIVMAEALACGTPVLGFRRGAVPEVVTDGENGFVRETNQELAACIPHISNTMRIAARRVCEERFSDNVIAHSYLNTYANPLA